MMKKIQLKGRVIFQFEIETLSGLHIGGSDAGIEIGGVNKIAIRNPWNNQPYIPGSSLKGKMRSLLEKYKGLEQNNSIGSGTVIHTCGANYKEKDDKDGKKLEKIIEEYKKCPVCPVFGLPGESKFSTPTRLVVRDIYLGKKSQKKLENAHTDLPYTEVKTEVSIDRVTSAANPRTLERVPAGASFGDEENPAEIVYSLYTGDNCDLAQDIVRLQSIVEGFALLEDDYLGGSGSRGSGKVKMKNIRVFLRTDYAEDAVELSPKEGYTVPELVANLNTLQKKITEATS